MIGPGNNFGWRALAHCWCLCFTGCNSLRWSDPSVCSRETTDKFAGTPPIDEDSQVSETCSGGTPQRLISVAAIFRRAFKQTLAA